MNVKEEMSMIGKIVDLPLADFEKELVKQKVNIGTINNLILNLESIYYELRVRKDHILAMKLKGDKDDSIDKALQGLYAEMIKTEQKITYLKQRREKLINVDNPTN